MRLSEAIRERMLRKAMARRSIDAYVGWVLRFVGSTAQGPVGMVQFRRAPQSVTEDRLSIAPSTPTGLTEADIADLQAGLAAMAPLFAKMYALQAAHKQAVPKMGARSEAFCRETLSILEQNPQLVPPRLKLDEGLAELRKFELMSQVLLQMNRMRECVVDMHLEMRSKIMAVALDGYKLLKGNRGADGLRGLTEDLSGRFHRRGGTKVAKVPAS